MVSHLVIAKSNTPSNDWKVAPLELYNVIRLSHRSGTVRTTVSVGDFMQQR